MKRSLLLLLTVLAGSCGGGDDDSAAPPPKVFNPKSLPDREPGQLQQLKQPPPLQPPPLQPGPPQVINQGPVPAPSPGQAPSLEPPEPLQPPLTWVQQDSGTEFNFTLVTAVDADHAWAAERDRIHRTVDGGATWIDVEVDFQGYITDLKFFDSLNGWALTSHQLCSTSDGGDTWVERASRSWPGPYFAKMCFLDMDTGWVALGRNQIWRTTNGGASWASSNIAPSVGNRYVEAVGFADSQVGWILTYNWAGNGLAEVLKTTDGGAWWTPQVAIAGYPAYFADIAPLSPTVACVVGGDDGELIFGTTDGGDTWVEQDRNSFSVGLCRVHFIDADRGWAAGIKIKRTTDGGATWQFEKVPQIGFADVHFVDETTGWAVGQNGLILKATMADEGDSAPAPQAQEGWVVQESGSVSDMSAVSAVDAEHAWAMGRYGSCTDLLVIEDGGSEWSFLGPGEFSWEFDYHPTVTQMHFFDSQTGFRHNSYTLERTTDGGRTWELRYGSIVGRLTAMSWISPTTGWIAHLNGWLSKTTDGGETWDSVPVPSGINFMRKVKFVDENVGWITALGSSGQLFKTEDGGQNWSQGLNPGGVIRDLFAISGDRAWIVGMQGDSEFIMATTDGTTWEAQSSNEPDDLKRVFFIDADNGWAVGQKIHHTSDGGATWTVQPTSQEGFSDVIFVDADTGWVVGDNGVILKTTTGGE